MSVFDDEFLKIRLFASREANSSVVSKLLFEGVDKKNY